MWDKSFCTNNFIKNELENLQKGAIVGFVAHVVMGRCSTEIQA